MSSSLFPLASIRPSFRTMILSAILIEVRRWAMTTVVLSDRSRAMFA